MKNILVRSGLSIAALLLIGGFGVLWNDLSGWMLTSGMSIATLIAVWTIKP